MKKELPFLALPLMVGLGGLFINPASAMSGDVAGSISCEGVDCVLNSDAAGQLQIEAGEEVNLNLNNHTILNDATAIMIGEGGKLTLSGTGTVTSVNKTAIFAYGEGAELVINDEVNVVSHSGNGIALGQTNNTSATLTMNGGTVRSQEFGVLASMDSVVTINDGELTTNDNCVVGGNGQGTNIKEKGITININGGELEGNIQSAGYASCGVYMPQDGEVNITGGLIYSTNGAGVVMRAGDLNITGGTIVADGEEDFVGKVGDSRVVVPTSAVVFDYDANYPGYIAGGTSGRISGDAEIVGASEPIETVNSRGEDEDIQVSGGKFDAVPGYVIDGYDSFFDSYEGLVVVLAVPKTVSEATDVKLAEMETYNITGLPMEYERYFDYGDESALDLTVDSTEIVASNKTGTENVKITMNGAKASYILADYNVTVTEPNYNVIDGDDSEYYLDEGGSLVFRFSGPIELVAKVYMDGELVDPSNYTLTEGSTIVTFNAEYLATLSEGEHTVMVSYTNGGVATASFTVAESNVVVPNTDASGTTPETGSFTSESEGASTSIATALGVSVFVGVITTAAGLVVVKRHYNK